VASAPSFAKKSERLRSPERTASDAPLALLALEKAHCHWRATIQQFVAEVGLDRRQARISLRAASGTPPH